MKWKNKGKEFEYMKDFFEKKHTYVIWGAGTYGISFYESYKDYFDIVCFIDSSEKKQGTKIHDVEVISPNTFFETRTDEIVLVATGFTSEVYRVLMKNGLNKGTEYFHVDEMVSLYMWYVHNIVCISDLIFGITQRCTLNCEYCIAFVPHISKPIDYPIDDILADVDVAMEWVDEVSVLGLVGGDAMMHKDFLKILEYIGDKYYPSRIKHFDIYSNAVIPIDETTIKIFKRFDVFYRFTDYSLSTSKQRINEIEEQLLSNNIRCDHAYFSEWFDCGYPQESNGIVDDNALAAFFDSCDRKECHMVKDKHLFSCGACINADIIDYCKIEESDYFDLSCFDNNRKSEFIEYYLGYSEKGYMAYCKKCNGGANVNSHSISVGSQK